MGKPSSRILEDILNCAYREALKKGAEGQSYSRRYRHSVAKLRYGPDTPLELYFAPRGEFISVFGLESYIDGHIGYDVERDGQLVLEFEDRGDDIFSTGKTVFVTIIPYYTRSDEWDWYIRIHRNHKAANDNSNGEIRNAA